jgi:hypothetical protein
MKLQLVHLQYSIGVKSVQGNVPMFLPNGTVPIDTNEPLQI